MVQSQVSFNRVPEKVPEKVWGVLVQSQGRFNRVPEKVLEKVPAALVQSQVQQGSGERSGEGFGRFCRARSGSTGFRRRFRRRCGRILVKSQVRSNRVPEKVPERFRRRFWEALVQSQARFNWNPEKVPKKVWEVLVQSQTKLNRVPE